MLSGIIRSWAVLVISIKSRSDREVQGNSRSDTVANTGYGKLKKPNLQTYKDLILLCVKFTKM
jgi:hypothetical protein